MKKQIYLWFLMILCTGCGDVPSSGLEIKYPSEQIIMGVIVDATPMFSKATHVSGVPQELEFRSKDGKPMRLVLGYYQDTPKEKTSIRCVGHVEKLNGSVFFHVREWEKLPDQGK